ncbi:hypothetical protein FOZ63_028998, partial [Perkinsus olseni]
MTRQAALLCPLTIIATIAASSYQAVIGPEGASPHLSTRLNMIFYDAETELGTVVGYLEPPGSEQVTITDVAHVDHSWERDSCVEFTVVADEDVVRKYNTLLNDEVSQNKTIRERTPPSLKTQAMRRFGLEILKGYEELFSPDGSALYTWSRADFWSANWHVHYKVFLSRPGVDQPLRLTALRAKLTPDDGRNCTVYILYPLTWFLDRVGDHWSMFHRYTSTTTVKVRQAEVQRGQLLTGSEEVVPNPSEHKWELSRRQLKAYSEYISPPGSNVSIDTWPKTLQVKKISRDPKAYYIPNIVHWPTMGTLEAFSRESMGDSL